MINKIRKILKEEMSNSNEKRYLDEVLKRLISDLYVVDDPDVESFSSVGEMNDIGIFHDEIDEIISGGGYHELGWDYDMYEGGESGYFFRVDEPDEHYDYDEFKYEVIYDWLDKLVKEGSLSYDDTVGTGTWSIINGDKIIKSNGNFFLGYLYRNELHKTYELKSQSIKNSNRIRIMMELSKTYGIDDTNQFTYILDNFYPQLLSKLETMGINVDGEPDYDIHIKKINESVVDDFISFGKELLSLDDDFRVNLRDDGGDIETLASYDMENGEINVLSKDRAIPDIIRSIAHEMVHHKQNSRGDLRGRPEEGEDGSPWEDEANAKAGELVRIFGRKYPKIYDL
jgi:hypothetical protein